jgi:hypothetical protein
MQRYDWPENIPDEDIADEFAKADFIHASVRNFNAVDTIKVSIGGLGWWIPLLRVLGILGKTPQDLRAVYTPQREFVPRWFPFNFSWWGLNKKLRRLADAELPATVASFDELGVIPLDNERFGRLAAALQKAIRVYHRDGESGECDYIFTAFPSGETSKEEFK